MILQSQTTGDRSRFVVVVVIIFILGWLQTVVGGVGVYVVWCFYVMCLAIILHMIRFRR